VARADEQGKWKFVGMLPLFDPPREQAKSNHRKRRPDGREDQDGTGDQIAIAGETSKQLGLGTNILDASSLGDLKKDATAEEAKAIEVAMALRRSSPNTSFTL